MSSTQKREKETDMNAGLTETGLRRWRHFAPNRHPKQWAVSKQTKPWRTYMGRPLSNDGPHASSVTQQRCRGRPRACKFQTQLVERAQNQIRNLSRM